MRILTRDDTEHDKEYVKLADATREIEKWKEKADYWKSACTLYADERNELRDAVKNLRDVKGRHHTELAARALYALLPDERHNADTAIRVDIQREGTEYWARVVADPVRPESMPLASGPTREMAIHAACEKSSIPPNA